jgi:4-amino-4-deoxy-L-arabinose transferase-like glycosyltransferase
MSCSSSSSARHRFAVRCYTSGALVVFFSIADAVSFRLLHLHGIVAYLVAVLPALPILWALLGVAQYLSEEKDEFQRGLHVQYLLWGTGGTLAVATVWGYLEDFTRVPHLDLIYIYPIFWLFVAVAMPVVNRRYR